MWKHEVIHKTGSRPYVFYRIAVRGGPSNSQTYVTFTENLVKFGRVVFEICERTDKQTDTLIIILLTRPGCE